MVEQETESLYGDVDAAAITDEEERERRAETEKGGKDIPYKWRDGWNVLKICPPHRDMRGVPFAPRINHFVPVGEDAWQNVICPRRDFKDEAPCLFHTLSRRLYKYRGPGQEEIEEFSAHIRGQRKFLWLGVDYAPMFDLEADIPEFIEDGSRRLPRCFGQYLQMEDDFKKRTCKRCVFRDTCVRGVQVVAFGARAHKVMIPELKQTIKAGTPFTAIEKGVESPLVFVKKSGKGRDTEYQVSVSRLNFSTPSVVRRLVAEQVLPVSQFCVPTSPEKAREIFAEMLAFLREEDPDLCEAVVKIGRIARHAGESTDKSEMGGGRSIDEKDDDGFTTSARTPAKPAGHIRDDAPAPVSGTDARAEAERVASTVGRSAKVDPELESLRGTLRRASEEKTAAAKPRPSIRENEDGKDEQGDIPF